MTQPPAQLEHARNHIPGSILAAKPYSVPEWLGYLFAIANVGSVTLVKIAFADYLGPHSPFLLYFWAVMASAYVGGLRPALLSVVLAVPPIGYYFLPPFHSTNLTPVSWGRLIVFVAEGVLVGWMVAAMREARARAEAISLALKESQELFEEFMEHSPAAASIKDEEGRTIYVNRTAEQAYHWEPGSWIGRTDQELWPAEQAGIFQETDQRVLRSGEPEQLVERIVVEDQELAWLTFKFPLHRSFGPKLLGSVSVDITDRERALRALEESEERLRLALEGAKLGTWYYNPATRRLALSPRCSELFCVDGEDIDYQQFQGAIHPEDQERVTRAVQDAIATGSEFDCEYRTVGLEGQRLHWISCRGRGVPGADGQVERFVGIAYDITAEKLAEAELHRLNEELAAARDEALAASRAKSAFLANMSHELRTPLNAVIGYTELLEEDATSSGYSELLPDLRRIHSAGRHLLLLINDILDLSKIEAGKMEILPEQFQIRPVLEDTAATLAPLAERNGNALRVDCPADIGSMYSDPAKLRQTLFNLLSNACKFTESGSIRLSARREDDTLSDGISWIVFQVSDTGIGIDPGKMDLLFREFSQLDSSSTRRYEGTGLGLAISKRMTQALGGTITVESERGSGSTFTVRLPAHHHSSSPQEVKPEPSTASTE